MELLYINIHEVIIIIEIMPNHTANILQALNVTISSKQHFLNLTSKTTSATLVYQKMFS